MEHVPHREGFSRRKFLGALGLGGTALGAGCSLSTPVAPALAGPADLTVTIRPILVDIAKDHTIRTIGYDGLDPAEPIRMREGVPVKVELINDTETRIRPLAWHDHPRRCGRRGGGKELVVPAHGQLRYTLTPSPSGSRWVHSHVMSMSDLQRGTYTGQFHFVCVQAKNDAEQTRPRRRASQGFQAQQLGDRISTLHHQRQMSRIRRAPARQAGRARAVSHPQRRHHREYPTGARRPCLPGGGARRQSPGASAAG